MRIGLVQLCAGDDMPANIAQACRLIAEAADQGAALVATPEVTNFVSMDRARQTQDLCLEEEDPCLEALRALASLRDIWVLAGSLALKSSADARFVNRSFLINPDGEIAARYDKMHMFDVELPNGQRFAESSAYAPGSEAVLADMGDLTLGMAVCYDMRFPALSRALAQAGAQVISYPSAFTVPTGQAHWETLLRARAIETGSYVIAPAQAGRHPTSSGLERLSYGHSLAVDPWGAVVCDMAEEIGAQVFDIDPNAVREARARIPALEDRAYKVGP